MWCVTREGAFAWAHIKLQSNLHICKFIYASHTVSYSVKYGLIESAAVRWSGAMLSEGPFLPDALIIHTVCDSWEWYACMCKISSERRPTDLIAIYTVIWSCFNRTLLYRIVDICPMPPFSRDAIHNHIVIHLELHVFHVYSGLNSDNCLTIPTIFT